MSTRHRQQVAHSHCLQILADIGWQFVGEVVDDLVCQRHLSFGNSQSYSSSSKCLADGVEHMRCVFLTLALPTTIDDVTAFYYHHTMDVFLFGSCPLQETFHRFGNIRWCFCAWQTRFFGFYYSCQSFNVLFQNVIGRLRHSAVVVALHLVECHVL